MDDKLISKLTKITFLDVLFLSLLTLILFLSRIRLQSYINKFNSIMPNLNSLIPGLQNQDLESINKATLIVSKFENLTNLILDKNRINVNKDKNRISRNVIFISFDVILLFILRNFMVYLLAAAQLVLE